MAHKLTGPTAWLTQIANMFDSMLGSVVAARRGLVESMRQVSCITQAGQLRVPLVKRPYLHLIQFKAVQDTSGHLWVADVASWQLEGCRWYQLCASARALVTISPRLQVPTVCCWGTQLNTVSLLQGLVCCRGCPATGTQHSTPYKHSYADRSGSGSGHRTSHRCLRGRPQSSHHLSQRVSAGSRPQGNARLGWCVS